MSNVVHWMQLCCVSAMSLHVKLTGKRMCVYGYLFMFVCVCVCMIVGCCLLLCHTLIARPTTRNFSVYLCSLYFLSLLFSCTSLSNTSLSISMHFARVIYFHAPNCLTSHLLWLFQHSTCGICLHTGTHTNMDQCTDTPRVATYLYKYIFHGHFMRRLYKCWY